QDCRCSEERVRAYRQRLSGPLLDRIDLHVEVPRLQDAERSRLLSPEADREQGSAAIRARVLRCRARQLARQGMANAQLGPADLQSHCPLREEDARLLEEAVKRVRLSLRAWHRLIKI